MPPVGKRLPGRRSPGRAARRAALLLVLLGAGRLAGEEAAAVPDDPARPAPAAPPPPPPPQPPSTAGERVGAPAPLLRYRDGRPRHEASGPVGMGDGWLLFIMGGFSPEIDAVTYVDRDHRTSSADGYGRRYGGAVMGMDLVFPERPYTPYLSLTLEMDSRSAEIADHRSISEINPFVEVGFGLLQKLGGSVAIYGGPKLGVGYVFISDQRVTDDPSYQRTGEGMTMKAGLEAGMIVACGGTLLIGQVGYEVKISEAHFGDASHDFGTAEYVARGFVFSIGIGGSF